MKIPSLRQIANLFRSPKMERGYRDVVAVGGANSDWRITSQGEDADVWMNSWLLTARVRDLFRTNPLYQKYREILWANVFGEAGIMLRMKIKEQEDRVVYAADEKMALLRHERRINRIIDNANRMDGRTREHYRAMQLADVLSTSERTMDTVLRAKATIQVGEPDVFANQLIERRWQEWQRAEFSDARGTRDYKTIRQLRLISAVRDGDCFIRMVKTPKANKFGFTLQIINAEWCDRFFNAELASGNVVRMGIEYQQNDWGIGKPVAYYFIRRQPSDWQFSNPGQTGSVKNPNYYVRVPADEIVHYCRPVDADGTRPAPWVASTIPKARQLDQYELAEVIAAREAACKTGFLYSDVVPEGGMLGTPINPLTGTPVNRCDPGGLQALPFGVKFQERNPTHPTANFESFRKGMLRSQCAGMPGSDYSTMANDYEAISFSAGRLQRLDSNEIYFLLQRNDIDVAENTVFENWLDMALIMDAIPLPYAKFDKFNSKVFQGRRFAGVDEVKEVTAAALRVANNFSSHQFECAQMGKDAEEILIERAEFNMMCEELGVEPMLTVQSTTSQVSEDDEDDTEEDDEETGKKPAAKTKVSKNRLAMNGHGA